MKTKIIINAVLFFIFLLLGNSVHGYEIYECSLKTIDICDINLSVITQLDNYSNGEKIEFYNNLSIKIDNFMVEYWIEDKNGSIIKDKRNTTNLNKKSYTTNLDGSNYITIKNKLVNISCANNPIGEKRVYVKDNRDINPNIELINLSNNLTIYSEGNIHFDLKYYSGNIENSLIIINLSKINSQTFNVNKKYYENVKTINMPYNCDIDSGTYSININGFNLSLENNIQITNNCQNQELNETTDTKVYYNTSENNINSEESQITGYAIVNPKGPPIPPYLIYILFGLIILGMVFLWRNKFALKNKNGISCKSNN